MEKNDIAIMLKEIVDKIGHPLIDDGYYSNREYGREYVYDNLRIVYYNTNSIYVYLSNSEVFYYDFNSDKSRFFDDKWKELIEIIYLEIPNIINKKKRNNNYKKLKKNK